MEVCRCCHVQLTDENWWPCMVKKGRRECGTCASRKHSEKRRERRIRLGLPVYPDKNAPPFCRYCRCELTGENWASARMRRNDRICIDCLAAERRRARENDIATQMMIAAKSRAKKSGTPFNLSSSDIFVPDVCPALGIPLIVSVGLMTDNSPSVDRIHADLGYVKGNVEVISYKANRIKNNGSPDDVMKVAKWLESRTK